MNAQHLSRTASARHQIRRRYLAGAGIVLAVAVAIGTLGRHGVPTRSQASATPLAAGAVQSISEMPQDSVIPQRADLSDAIYVVRSGRDAATLRHSQPELRELPRAQVLVIGYGTNAATAWQEIKDARESSGDRTASVIDLR